MPFVVLSQPEKTGPGFRLVFSTDNRNGSLLGNDIPSRQSFADLGRLKSCQDEAGPSPR
jgi:hypothetical protein